MCQNSVAMSSVKNQMGYRSLCFYGLRTVAERRVNPTRKVLRQTATAMLSRLSFLLVLSLPCASCHDTAEQDASRPAAFTPLEAYGEVIDTGPCNLADVGPSAVDESMAGATGPFIATDLSPATPVKAIDHTVTYGGADEPERHIMLRRSGPFFRFDSGWSRAEEMRKAERSRNAPAFVRTRSSEFRNVSTAAQVSADFAADGMPIFARFTRGQSAGTKRRDATPATEQDYRVTRTARRESIAGETCTVWTALPAAEFSARPRQEACITDDGIVLRATSFNDDNEVTAEDRAITVERGPVPPGDILPPRALLDWSEWAVQPSKQPPDRSSAYTVTLGRNTKPFVPWRGWGSPTQTHVVQGADHALAYCSGQTTGDMYITTPRAVLSYSERDGLVLQRHKAPQNRPAISRKPIEAPGRTLLGETCSWFEISEPRFNTLLHRNECQTADGIPLIIDEDSEGPPVYWKATSLTRKLPEGAASRPSSLLDWENWGWPER
tara:strand:- start:98 stop:1582 length:1485 start_codon:yes stop_codon:yes gene_type:complete